MSRSRPRSSRERVEGLKLSLGMPQLYKSVMPNGCPELILIDDEDEDVQICPPASSGEVLSFYPYSSTNTWTPPIREVDLELRLGTGDSSGCHGISNPAANEVGNRLKDLPNCQYMASFPEVKLRCAICMDTMKEEASTTCGHVFCKPCITSAVRLQKRCPTCRERLSLSNIHRIYLPGATS